MVKVTVVVPVYNPGPFIEPGIESLLAQTMAPDEYEVVLVDDGSTDDTPARLDALAAAHPNIRVIHIPNSGWAGRPRNVGTQAARGEYVQYMDQDDSLTPSALSMLYEMATRNRSDIVIGKVASNFRPVPQHLFRRNIEACTLRDAPLISSLTPHKMFRTAFLREHGIEFPEGRRRLEDQLFMVRAYLAAGTVSVLADSVCYLYARRADGGNAASRNPDPEMYFANLREVLEAIVAGTEPGPFRTELLGRFYRTGLIDRVSEPFYLSRPEPVRQALYREIRALALDYGTDQVQATLGTVRQVRSRLLLADRRTELVELARRLRALRATATLGELRWTGRRLSVEFMARLVFQPDGRPFELVRRGDATLLDPGLLEGILDEPVAVHEPAPWVRLECFVRERSTGAEWRVPVTVRVDQAETREAGGDVRMRPTFHASATLDVDRIAGGRPLGPGSWELRPRLFGPGIDRRCRLSPVDGVRLAPAAMISPDAGPTVVALAEARAVSLRVGPVAVSARDAGQSVARSVASSVIELPIADPADPTAGRVEVVARRDGVEHRLEGRLETSAGGHPVLVVSPGPAAAAGGHWRLSARVDGPGRPEREVGTLEIGVAAPPRIGRLAAALPVVGRLRRVARRPARAIAPHLSARLRRRIADRLGRWI